MEFKKNDLVWIKSKGFPLWPGFIIDEKTAQYLGDIHQVNINNENIFNYNENFEKLSKQKIKKKNYCDSFKFAVNFSELINQNELNCDDFYDFLIFKKEQKLKFSMADLKYFLSKFLKKDELLKKIDFENNINNSKHFNNENINKFKIIKQKNNNSIENSKNHSKEKKEKKLNKKRKKSHSKIEQKSKLKIIIPIEKENKKNDSISLEEEINTNSNLNSKINSKVISGKNTTTFQTKNEDEKNTNELILLNSSSETNFNNIISMKEIFHTNEIKNENSNENFNENHHQNLINYNNNFNLENKNEIKFNNENNNNFCVNNHKKKNNNNIFYCKYKKNSFSFLINKNDIKKEKKKKKKKKKKKNKNKNNFEIIKTNEFNINKIQNNNNNNNNLNNNNNNFNINLNKNINNNNKNENEFKINIQNNIKKIITQIDNIIICQNIINKNLKEISNDLNNFNYLFNQNNEENNILNNNNFFDKYFLNENKYVNAPEKIQILYLVNQINRVISTSSSKDFFNDKIKNLINEISKENINFN